MESSFSTGARGLKFGADLENGYVTKTITAI